MEELKKLIEKMSEDMNKGFQSMKDESIKTQ